VAALERLKARVYDLILSDLRMPELDGPGLYREAGRLDPALQRRFIFLTGDTLSPEAREFLEETRVPSLVKPFTVEDVRRIVREAVTALADSRKPPR
jgi:two-component system NtrC family sensor kinase